jgi:hypothetical protein
MTRKSENRFRQVSFTATGQPLGTQTCRVTMSGGLIVDRRRAEDDNACASKTFDPISRKRKRLANNPLILPLKMNRHTNGIFQFFR